MVRNDRLYTYLRQPGSDSFVGHIQSFRRYVHWLVKHSTLHSHDGTE